MEIEEIVKYYKSHGGGVKEVARELHISPATVKKVLITYGLYSNETSILISQMIREGLTKDEIIKKLGISRTCYCTNSPYEKTFYLSDNKSVNAQRIAKSRSKCVDYADADHEIDNADNDAYNPGEVCGLSSSQIENLISAGGRRTIFGANDRIYISAESIGLNVETDDAGNISHATISGIEIAPEEAEKLMCAKPWVETNTGNIYVSQYDGDVKTVQKLVRKIMK